MLRGGRIGYTRKMKNIALVLAGLVLGAVAAAGLTGRVMAQSARAQAPAAPLKWQQFCEPAASIAEASSLAGARGTEGWELVSFANGAICFKRLATARNRLCGRMVEQTCHGLLFSMLSARGIIHI